MTILSRTDLVYAMAMIYGYFPMKNGNLNMEEIKKRATDSQYIEYLVIKIISSAAGRKIVEKLPSKYGKYSSGAIVGLLVGVIEYIRSNNPNKTLNTQNIITHAIAHYLLTTVDNLLRLLYGYI